MNTDWNVLLYLAADNDLSDKVEPTLKEVLYAAPLGNIAVLAEADFAGSTPSKRWHLPAGSWKAHETNIPEKDSGDYRTLVGFAKWALAHAPASKTVLTIWNHGDGLGSLDDDEEHTGGHHAPGQPRTRLFGYSRRSTGFPLYPFNVGFDITSGHVIDNLDLKHGLEGMRDTLGRPADVLVFDACVMNTVEIVYQLRDVARYVVGAQAALPDLGIAYTSVLNRMKEEPDIRPRELSMAITEESYGNWSQGAVASLSVIDMKELRRIVTAIDALARSMLDRLQDPTVLDGIMTAHYSARQLPDTDTVDLVDLCRRLARYVDDGQIRRAARSVAVLTVGKLVVVSKTRGRELDRAHGISIYMPKGRPAGPLYRLLDFADDCAWADFLDAYYKAIQIFTQQAPPAAHAH